MSKGLWKSILNRYNVDTVPTVLLPFFYFFSYGCAVVCFVYAILVHYTSKIVFEGEKHLASRPNYILCHWHTYIILYFVVFIRHHSHAWMQHPLWFMKVSHLFLRFIGVEKIILGSTGHHGHEAANLLVESLKNGYSTVLLPDGPGGPAFVAKKGVLHIALQSGIPILPIRFQTARVIQLKTWDKKKWPLSFCTIRVQYLKPIRVTNDKFDEAYDELTKALG
jgi:lysophospholipid acyltransferase (LPLAT)-like uncharacterized protein